MDLSQDDVIQIIKFMDESKFDELHLENGDLKLVVNRRRARNPVGAPEIRFEDQVKKTSSRNTTLSQTEELSPPSISVPAKEETSISKVHSESVPEEDGLIPIHSPMLGTFYRAPTQDDPPFVEVGTVVSEENTVCIIEVMKLFSAIKAEVRGRIVRICAENGQMVEYNQVLFLVEPEAE